MRVFDFDAAAHAAQYAARGYVHAVKGVRPEFLAYARAQAQALMGADADLKEWNFKGKKAQFLFELPAEAGWYDALKDTISAVTGLARSRLTLCERHIKVYDANAPETPPPHKDRLASEVAVGFPLVVAPGSHLVLWPDHDVAPNVFSSTAMHRSLLDPEVLPEKRLAGIEPVRIDMQPGDVVMFRGSAIYHERVKPANSVVLYLKFNALRLDPLGEDPATPAQRRHSLERLQASDAALLGLALEPSPRLDRVTRLYSRLEWAEVLQAQVWGEKEFCISELELKLIRAADARTPLGALVRSLGYAPGEEGEALAAVRRLVRLQALDLVPATPFDAQRYAEDWMARAAATA